MIYLYKANQNESIADVLESANVFFTKVENEQDLKTNISIDTKNTFIVDYKDIVKSKKLAKIIKQNSTNKYVIIVSCYVSSLLYKEYEHCTILLKPYSIKDILTAVK